jgi:hypothetical protein
MGVSEIFPSMACGGTDAGVSEVVGTVLMVAIMTILAGIVASMLFAIQMPEEPKTVVVTATRSGDTITFINYGGPDLREVSEIRCWIGGVNPGNPNVVLGASAGAVATYQIEDKTRVLVVVKYAGDRSKVLLDKML